MRVIFPDTLSGLDFTFQKGCVYELPDDIAERWTAAGHCAPAGETRINLTIKPNVTLNINGKPFNTSDLKPEDVTPFILASGVLDKINGGAR